MSPLPANLVAEALALQSQGRLDEAAGLYQRVLRAQPKNVDALHFSGILKLQLGLPEEGVKLLRAALKIRPDFAPAHLNLGIAQQSLARHADALLSFERAAALRADYAEAHCNRGSALQALGRDDASLQAYDKALAIRSAYPEALSNRGNLLRAMGRHQQALDSYERALSYAPDFAEIINNRGIALRELNRFDAALASFDAALARMPRYPDALHNRGNALFALGRAAEALDSFELALALKPAFPECLFGKANALMVLKRGDEALLCLDRALVLRPDYAEARTTRGTMLMTLGLYEAALSNCDAALAVAPGNAQMHTIRGLVLRELQRLPEAILAFERALAIDADCRFAFGNLIHSRRMVCDWADCAADLARVCAAVQAGKPLIVPMDFSVISDAAEDQLRCARVFMHTASQHSAPIVPTLPVLPRARARDQRIRVAYISPDFREHAVAFLTAGVFEHHDRSRFETIAIALNPDLPGAMTDRLKGAFDHFIHAYDQSDQAVAILMREMGVDIAVDLAGPTQNSRERIFAYRPAPVQVSYLGFPGTQGSEHIDYIIADDFVIPEQRQQCYAEKVVYLPDCFQANDDRREIAPVTLERASAGLPAAGFVFCSFNHSVKITPDMFAIWMGMLKQVPGSVLWLLADLALAQRNLRAEAEKQGVDPARLIFAQRMAYADHLARLRLADLFLDSLPYNAGTNASDALWAGLPVLTCCGDAFAARMAGSLLRAVGLPDLITHDLQAYAALGTALALDQTSMGELKARLARNRLTHALFDTARFTRHLESAYEQMWHLNQQGLPPRPIVVTALAAADVVQSDK
jgi:predicted O-linked N-acetylglucosamine transferase (SPINDLY family)